MVQFLAETFDFYDFQNIQTSSCAHQASYLVGTRGSFLTSETAELRMCGTLLSLTNVPAWPTWEQLYFLPLYVFLTILVLSDIYTTCVWSN